MVIGQISPSQAVAYSAAQATARRPDAINAQASLTPLSPPTPPAGLRPAATPGNLVPDGLAVSPQQVREQLTAPAINPGACDPAVCRANATQKLEQARESLKKAGQPGLDIVKRTFFTKALGVALTAASVAVAAALTVFTAGAAAPFLAVAGASLIVQCGNAYCAYRNYKNAEAVANHKDKPYADLPMGNSCVANVVYAGLKQLGVERPQSAARMAGRTVALALGVASIAMGYCLTVDAASAGVAVTKQVVKYLTGSTVALSALTNLGTQGSRRREMRANFEDAVFALIDAKKDLEAFEKDPEAVDLCKEIDQMLLSMAEHNVANDFESAKRNGRGIVEHTALAIWNAPHTFRGLPQTFENAARDLNGFRASFEQQVEQAGVVLGKAGVYVRDVLATFVPATPLTVDVPIRD